MLPEVGKRKLVATLVFTAAAFVAGCGLVYTGKISGSEFVSVIWAASVVVGAFLGANVAATKFEGGK